MLLLAITSGGLAESIRIATEQDSVWCGADAITEVEFKALGASNVTRLTYALGSASSKELANAVATIEEHHPGQRVWVEHV